MIKSLSKTVLIGALSTFLSLQSVSASVIETMTAQDVSDAINIAIIDAKVIDDESNGHKVVEGRIDNYVFFVRLKSCEETNTFCRDLVFLQISNWIASQRSKISKSQIATMMRRSMVAPMFLKMQIRLESTMSWR